ncbi:MAG: radical SAM protein [Synechococcus sp.]|nr:radical SAM protein [Synechococcus sp.]
MTPRDQHGRPLGVLRLSLTARCNLSCSYCQPDGHEAAHLLSQAQQLALIRAACQLGCHTLRLTGGEPLLAPGLLPLLEAIQPQRHHASTPLAQLREVALTSNGLLLTPQKAKQLRQAGLTRLTISLDGTDPTRLASMAGLQGGASAGQALLQRVLQALQAAREAGFAPERGELKLNSVIQRHRNDDQLLPLARLARHEGVELRLIEYMDVGQRNGWQAEAVVPATEMIQTLQQQWPLEPLGRAEGGTASRWRYRDGGGLVGVIASISQPFCGDCNRLRVTADGMAYSCLFGTEGFDLKPWLQPEVPPQELQTTLAQLWHQRKDRASEERQHGHSLTGDRAEMAYLGG